MMAKRKLIIENYLMLKQLILLKSAGFVSREDVEKMKATTDLPKTSFNTLVRLGFFILGATLYSSILGFFTIFLPQGEINYPYVMLFFSFIGFAIAEGLARIDFHNFGLDDAFIILSQMMFCGALGVISNSPTLVFMLLMVVGAFCCYRYYNTGSIVLSLVGASSLASSVVTVYKILDPVFLPFLLLLTAAIFLLVHNQIKNREVFRLYPRSVHAVKVFALVLAYLAVNYAVYKEVYQDLQGFKAIQKNAVPLAGLFYVLTILWPLMYIFIGIKKQDKTFLHIGILAGIASIFTLKYLHTNASLESYLLFVGSTLILVAGTLVRKLFTKQTGITFLADKFDESTFSEHTQAFVLSSQSSFTRTTTSNHNSFGGGNFSGGGSSGNY